MALNPRWIESEGVVSPARDPERDEAQAGEEEASEEAQRQERVKVGAAPRDAGPNCSAHRRTVS